MGPLERKEAGNGFFKDGKWNEAIAEYTAGLEESSPDFPPDQKALILSNRSQCWLKLDNYQKALEDADACLKILPEHTKSLFRRATALEKLGRSAEALADFARVARAEPQNRSAVEAAKRLRDEVARHSRQRQEEVLPSNLLQVLRKSACGTSNDAAGQVEPSIEDQLEACSKLRMLCFKSSQASVLLGAGALELLLERTTSDCALELRQAFLACLVALASGQEADDRHEATSNKDVSGPLPVPAPAADARKQIRTTFNNPNSQSLAQLQRLCRDHAGSMRNLATLIGYCHEPEDEHALDVLHTALNYSEGGEIDVPRAGIVALVAIFDTRRRLGKLGKPVMPSKALLKCLESALGTTSCSELLQSLLAEVFALLADTERPQGMEVDLAAVGLRVLEPFLQSEDPSLRSNGLAGLSCLLAASTKAATLLIQQSPAPLAAVLGAISRPMAGPEGREGQGHAAECLLLATADQKIRQHWIDGGGIDMLLATLSDGDKSSRGLVDAKLVAVLAIVAAHSKEVREEVFERIDFMMELRFALDIAHDGVQTAQGDRHQRQARRLARGLYESCVCLAIHGEFKEVLVGTKKTLSAMQGLARQEDLAEDPHLSFLFASLVYNLCRSREDKVKTKKGNSMLDDLGDDDLKALEEFYERMPAESRPAKNGEVDAGSKELAKKLQAWCVQQAESGGSPPVVAKLGKCAAHGSPQTKALTAMALKLICSESSYRRFVVAGGGIRTLLMLVDLQDEGARDAARQALAQICIVTNPALLQYSEQLDAVRPLMQLLEHRHELLQFEGAMGLTNLLTVSDELRARALQADCWRLCRDLLFSENEQVQRAGLEAMCNLTMAPEVLERFAEGRAELELKLFGSFCNCEDEAAQAAASGALAMLAGYPEVALQVAASEQGFAGLLQAVLESENPAVQHRAVSAVCSICEAEGCPPACSAAAKRILRERCSKGGFGSAEAQALAKAALDS